MYIYNLDTGTLHIEGLCQYGKPTHAKFFETEKEAHDSCGQKIFICRICQRKREKLLKGDKK